MGHWGKIDASQLYMALACDLGASMVFLRSTELGACLTGLLSNFAFFPLCCPLTLAVAVCLFRRAVLWDALRTCTSPGDAGLSLLWYVILWDFTLFWIGILCLCPSLWIGRGGGAPLGRRGDTAIWSAVVLCLTILLCPAVPCCCPIVMSIYLRRDT